MAILSTIGALWVAFGLEPPLLKTAGSYGAFSAISLIIFAVSSFIAFSLSDLFPIFNLEVVKKSSSEPANSSANKTAKKAIIFLVSPENPHTGENRIVFNSETDSWQLDGKGERILSFPNKGATNTSRLAEARDLANGIKPFWPWQQILRGLVPHVKNNGADLPEVWLLGSSTGHGSFAQLPKLRELLIYIIPELKVYILGEKISDSAAFTSDEATKNGEQKNHGVDFEDFGALTHTLEMALHRIVVRRNNWLSWLPPLEKYYCSKKGIPRAIRYRDIIIDATGGQKTTSIAAATITMKSHVDFQYVQTLGDNDVLQYKVKLLEENHH